MIESAVSDILLVVGTSVATVLGVYMTILIVKDAQHPQRKVR